MERGGGRGEILSLTLGFGSVFAFASVFGLVFVFAGGAFAGGAAAGGASAGAFDEEVRYRLTSDTMVVVLLCRGLSFADTEMEGCVVRWVRTSWLVRVADCVSRICGGYGVSV